MFDPFLLTRSLSQALQATLAIAFCFCWAQRTGRQAILRGIRWSLVAAVPITLIAAWLFGQTSYQARWEATLATLALVVATWFAIALWRTPSESSPIARRADGQRVALLCAAAAVVVIVRQTMEIGVVLRAAIFDVRSTPAIAGICAGTALGLLASWAWIQVGRRLSDDALLKATRVFAVMFVAQVALYAFHESAEARMLPWSDLLHAATEPYGPDSTFGLYATGLLLIVPAITAGATFITQYVIDPVTSAATLGTLGVACVLAVVVSTTGVQSSIGGPKGMARSPAERPVSHDPERFLDSPHIVFRQTRRDADYGHLAVAALDAPDGARATAPPVCSRVSFGLDRGICLAPHEGVQTQTQYDAIILDAALKPVHTLPLTGTFSRTRTSVDGRFGVVTTFLTGQSHGYAAANFSTKTILLDMPSGNVIADLEEFTTIDRQGRHFKAVDFNFWGVTFAASDSNTFYATLRTGTVNYLVRGDIARRTATIVADNVECPSLSPDERWIAFKRRVGPMSTAWRLFVLDVSTMTDRAIPAVTSYVDDQVEWFDDTHILYAMPHLGTADVWIAAIDGNEPARILMFDAESPIVVRRPGTASATASSDR
jgi:hypothetical protein